MKFWRRRPPPIGPCYVGSLPLKNRNSASGQYGRVEASGKRRDETRVAPPRSHRMIAAEGGAAGLCMAVLVPLVGSGEANEASIGGLMVWWGWGGGELKCIAEGRCTAVAGGVKCEVREAMILRIALRRGRQGKPKSPGDNVGVGRGECRDEEGRDPA